MDAKRWGQIKEIYDRALDLSREGRESFLLEACAGDDDLRREVETLLAAHADAGTFLESPAVEVAARKIVADEIISPAPQLIGRELANYRIVSLLGRGGMGEVYLAQDRRLSRNVALKLLPTQFVGDKRRVLRFEQEARAVSLLNHPNIVTIFDAGQAYTKINQTGLAFTMYALLIIGGLNTVFSLVYYIKVLKVMIIEKPIEEVEGKEAEPLPVTPSAAFYATILSAMILLLGIFWNPLSRVSVEGVHRLAPESGQPALAQNSREALP